MSGPQGSRIELFDFADSRLGTTVEWGHPSVNGYEASNLLDKTGAALHSSISLLGTPAGFMAESFIKPPAELTLQLPFPVSLAAVVVNPRIRRHLAKYASLFVMGDRGQRWEYIGKLSWPDETRAQPLALCNGELDPHAVSSAVAGHGGSTCGGPPPCVLTQMERSPTSLHSVLQVKLRISAMHEAVALGIGRIEVWAQPSQRLPLPQRERLWLQARQALATQAYAPYGPAAEPNHAEEQPAQAECPAEFIDPITQNIMSDPVILPSNNTRCDRSTIERHLSAHSTDPFTGLFLEQSQIAWYRSSTRMTFYTIQKILGQRRVLLLRSIQRQSARSAGNVQLGTVQRRKVMQQFKDKAEVTVYDRQVKDTHYRWGPWAAVGQMLIWMNFADFYWRYSMDKDEETGELVKSSVWTRAAIAGIALASGVSIGGGLLHFISRSVARMKVVDGGNSVVLETYRMSGRGVRAQKFPIASMFSRDTLYTGEGPHGVTKPGAPQYSIKTTGSFYAFIMNRQGMFVRPKALDTLFHRAVVNTD
ncbi:RING finger protein 37 [Coemansia sp. RSA 552]|nr:RING finger protein 37 [Coemansia sp. RSA 552]